MRPEDILELLRARPFEPFRVCLSDGSTYEIQHPDMAIVQGSNAWDAAALGLLWRWSDLGRAWGDRHRFALVAGLLAFFLLLGVLKDADEGFAGHSLVSAAAAVALWRVGIALRRRACGPLQTVSR